MDTFNEVFGEGFEDPERMVKVLVTDVHEAVVNDQEYINTQRHSDRQNAEIVHRQKVAEKMQEIMYDHTELYRRYSEDPAFRKGLEQMLFRMAYENLANPNQPRA